MKEYNDGIGESNILQNQFTAYLVTAIHRKKIQYLQAKSKQYSYEVSLDIQDEWKELRSEQDMMVQLPFLEQLDDYKLRKALEELKELEFNILVMKVLNERSFQEIANEIGIGYKTVASIYYRLIQKLHNKLEDDNEI